MDSLRKLFYDFYKLRTVVNVNTSRYWLRKTSWSNLRVEGSQPLEKWWFKYTVNLFSKISSCMNFV